MKTRVIWTGVLAVAAVVACGVFARPAVDNIPKSNYRIVDDDTKRNIKELELTTASTLFGLRLAPGSRILVEADRPTGDVLTSVETKAAVTYRGVDIPAGSYLRFREHRSDFSASPELRWLAIDAGGTLTMGVLVFQKGDVLRMKDDHLDSVRLARATTFGEKQVPAGADVEFNDLGEVTYVVTREQRQQKQLREDACRNRCAPYGSAVARWQSCMNACR